MDISTGFDPAPFIVNLFHYYYENKWACKFKKVCLNRARQLANIFRLIDDLRAMNDGGECERTYKEMCPPELEIKKQNSGNTEGSFWTFLSTQKAASSLAMDLFDKKRCFSVFYR